MVHFCIAAIASTNTASQAMPPRNDAKFILDGLVAANSATPVEGLTMAAAWNSTRDKVLEKSFSLESSNWTDVIRPYEPLLVECIDDCAFGVIPAVVDLVASLVDGPIHFGPTSSDGCVLVLELPLAMPSRDTPRNSTALSRRRLWFLCLVGSPGTRSSSKRNV